MPSTGYITMDKNNIEVYLDMIVDGEARGKKADLFSDGYSESWVPHSQIIKKTHIKDKFYEVVMSERAAKEKGFI